MKVATAGFRTNNVVPIRDWSEKRTDKRVDADEWLFAQVVECTNPAVVGTTFRCSLVDVSASGIRLVGDKDIPPGCMLELWIAIDDAEGKVYLSSDVRWCRERADEPGRFEIGVVLHNGTATDIGNWRNLKNLD